jgi:hypothetical protein
MRRSSQVRSLDSSSIVEVRRRKRERSAAFQLDPLGLITRTCPGRDWGPCYQFTQAGCTSLQNSPGCAMFTSGEAQELMKALAKELGYAVVLA